MRAQTQVAAGQDNDIPARHATGAYRISFLLIMHCVGNGRLARLSTKYGDF
jgi:hypothetical protein